MRHSTLIKQAQRVLNHEQKGRVDIEVCHSESGRFQKVIFKFTNAEPSPFPNPFDPDSDK